MDWQKLQEVHEKARPVERRVGRTTEEQMPTDAERIDFLETLRNRTIFVEFSGDGDSVREGIDMAMNEAAKAQNHLNDLTPNAKLAGAALLPRPS